MKTTIINKTILPTLIFAALSVNAMPISSIIPGNDLNDVIVSAELIKFELAPELQLAPKTGSVNIKADAIVLRLSEPSANCTTIACGSAPSKEISFEVPLKSVSKDECGIIKYIGNRNLLPVDGDNTVIEVTDNSHNKCPVLKDLLPLPATEVQLKIEYFNRIEGKYVNTTSQFRGNEFKATMVLL